jgi:hypothetical protein
MGVRLLHRVSRVLKRKNSRTEVTSTNLAHTAPYCPHAFSKTMAEQYHKTHSKTVPMYFPKLQTRNTASKAFCLSQIRMPDYGNPQGMAKDRLTNDLNPSISSYLLFYHIYPRNRIPSVQGPVLLCPKWRVRFTFFAVWIAFSQPLPRRSFPKVSLGAAGSLALAPPSAPSEGAAP